MSGVGRFKYLETVVQKNSDSVEDAKNGIKCGEVSGVMYHNTRLPKRSKGHPRYAVRIVGQWTGKLNRG